MRRFLTRSSTQLSFALLFLLVFLVLRNYNQREITHEDAEEVYTREPGTPSEEIEREKRRVNLNSIFIEGVTPQTSDNIFFIMGTDAVNDRMPRQVSMRQVCSIESALRAYPENIIYVIFIAHSNGIRFEMSKALYGLTYRNILLTMLNINEFIASTSLQFAHDELLSNSHYQYKHTLDIIRLVLLYKYGGTYIDNEMIVRSNLSHVKNFLCDEGFYSIIDTVMNFERRELVEILIEDMIKNFDGTVEAQQGSILLTRVMEKLCQSPRAKMKIDRKNCEGFNIINKEICYPIDSGTYWKLFDESETESVLEMVSNSSLVHLWNPYSATYMKSSNTAATKLMREFCPNTFDLADEYDFMDFM